MNRTWLAMTSGAIGLVLIATFSARGRDNDKHFVRTSTCADSNGAPSKDQIPESDCLEGHSCVHCQMENGPLGQLITGQGNPRAGKLMNPQIHDCGGNRLIGICTGNGDSGGGGGNCDISDYTIDGVCGGQIRSYLQQGTPGGQ